MDLNEATLAELAAASPAAWLMTVAGDVADPDFATATIERSADRFGALHGLVSMPGIVRAAMIDKMSKTAAPGARSST